MGKNGQKQINQGNREHKLANTTSLPAQLQQTLLSTTNTVNVASTPTKVSKFYEDDTSSDEETDEVQEQQTDQLQHTASDEEPETPLQAKKRTAIQIQPLVATKKTRHNF